jgi:hypothetical protein
LGKHLEGKPDVVNLLDAGAAGFLVEAWGASGEKGSRPRGPVPGDPRGSTGSTYVGPGLLQVLAQAYEE